MNIDRLLSRCQLRVSQDVNQVLTEYCSECQSSAHQDVDHMSIKGINQHSNADAL